VSLKMDNIAARLRPRSKWEAVDLGFALVRQWWQPILIAWLLVSLPIVLIIAGAAFVPPLLAGAELHGEFADVELFSASSIAILLLWWLKPLFERAPLYVLGEAMFGQVPSTRQIIKALPKLYWNNGIFASLTWRRLNLGRAFDFPIRQLEGSKGKFAAQRRRALNPYGWSPTATSAWVLVHVEVVLVMAVGSLVNMFWIGDGPFSYGFDLGGPENKLQQDIAYYSVYFLVLTFVELFYVAIGFALYLNARNSLEGWDIELAFRKLHARVEATPRKRAVFTASRSSSLGASTNNNEANGALKETAKGAASAKALVILLLAGIATVLEPDTVLAAAKTTATKTTESAAREARQDAARARAEARCGLLGMQLKPQSSSESADSDEDEEPNSDANCEAIGAVSDEQAAKLLNTLPQVVLGNALNGQSREARQAAIDELEADPRMGSSRDKTRLKYVGPEWSKEKKKQEKLPDVEWLKDVIGFMADTLKYIGWASLIGLIIYLIYRALKNAGWLELQRARAPLPDTLFGLDVRPESLPDDVPGAARLLLQAGDVRGALALIYRASLVFLLQDGKIEIANGDTEGECLRRVQAGYTDKPSFGAMMRALFNAWLWVAYKRAPLAISECEQLITTWQSEMQFVRSANLAQLTAGKT
jgi:hypothetical protein